MKTTSMGMALVAVSLVGIFGCTDRNNNDTQGGSQEQLAVEGKVVAIDLERIALDGPALITIDSNGQEWLIAIPSMGLPLCAGYEHIADAFSVSVGDDVSVAGSVDEEGRIVPCESSEHYLLVKSTVTSQEAGFSFDYRKGPEGYALQDLDTNASSVNPRFAPGYRLTLKEDAEKEQGEESPPAMSVTVFRNVENQSASVWVDRNPAISNIELAIGEVGRDEILAGANAVRYVVDGLYRSNVVVVAHGGFIYMIVGEFNDENSALRQDFEPLLDSFKFVPSQD